MSYVSKVTAPSRMRFWFLPLSGDVSEGDSLKDVD